MFYSHLKIKERKNINKSSQHSKVTLCVRSVQDFILRFSMHPELNKANLFRKPKLFQFKYV